MRGGVVEVCFPEELPEIHRILRAEDGEVVVEGLEQLDEERVRGIALSDTRGLARGDRLRTLGRSLPTESAGAPEEERED